MKRIINLGWQEDMPLYLQKRVQPTNIVALIILTVLILPFVVITQVYFSTLLIYPILGAVCCIIVLGLNYLGGIQHSRIVLSLAPILLAAIYNASLSAPEEGPIPSLYLMELCFVLIPFIIFDAKEKSIILGIALLCALIIITFPLTNDWLDSSYDSEILRKGSLCSMTVILAVVVQFVCITAMAYISRRAEKESETARARAEEDNKQLLVQQEENQQQTEKLEAAQAEEKKHQWSSSVIAQVSDLIRQKGDQENIFDLLLASIIKQLNLNQGGLFVVDRSDSDRIQIQLAACYAYDRKKFIEKTFAPGEGLLGQAYLERERLYYQDVPTDYVKITSGLGQSTPTSLLIMPLKVNEVVEGLLELASFSPFAEHEVTLLEKLGEVIGSYIQNQRMMRHTQTLLEQAQQQAEELQAVEEEMRQNEEELLATQEEMTRRQRELETQFKQREEALLEQLKGYESAE